MQTEFNSKASTIKRRRIEFPTFTYWHILIVQAVFLCIVIYRMVFRFIYPAPPLFYDVNDTFMDYFNTAYWTYHKDQTYTDWLSIYPPFAHFLCFISYGFLLFIKSYKIPQSPYEWRYDISLFLPFLLMIGLYLLSIYLLIRNRCCGSGPIFKLTLTLSLFLAVPSLFLIERGNLLMFSIIFINLGFLFKGENIGRTAVMIRSALIALATAVKPYLLILVFQFKRPIDYLVFTLTLVISNLAAVVLWQPTKPELMIRNQFSFASIDSGFMLLGKAAYNFAINTYGIVAKLVKLFIYGSQANFIVLTVNLLHLSCFGLLVYNIYRFFKTYKSIDSSISKNFSEFFAYSFGIYLITSLLTEANGYAIAFFIPTIILFVSYFPRARFNAFELAIICYMFFAITFLPESNYEVDYLNNFTSIISQILNLPLKFTPPTLTPDCFVRPIVLQLFFLVFISKVNIGIRDHKFLVDNEFTLTYPS